MKSKFLLPIIGLLASFFLIGTAYSAWVIDNSKSFNNNVEIEVPTWTFERDSDFALIDNITNCSYLTATKETSITQGSNEAVRLTNTAGTATKDHIFFVGTDRDYLLNEIKVMKVEFDYYHAEKRQQVGKGFPKVQLAYNGTGKGNTQGGGETCNAKSPFIATNIGSDWWHLEYFITALCPTNDITAHGDGPISKNQKINGIKIIDSAIYDYNSKTAFIVVDNVSFSSESASRLGIFNKGTSFTLAVQYYWFKICWVGELQSCVMTFSDPTVAEQDSYPFYIHALKQGSTNVTATLTLTTGQILSITNTITIT